MRLNFPNNFLRSPDLCFKASRRDKHDGVFSFSLSLLDKELVVKTLLMKNGNFYLKPTGSFVNDFIANHVALLFQQSKVFLVLLLDLL